ncbi:unnamed protein product [Colias eurytheme]|nr:unnamed protein product [Colias eurytheme]
MAPLCRFSLILCISTVFLVSQCECMKDVGDARAAAPFGIEKLCSSTSLLQVNKKIICLICKGLDPACWSPPPPPTLPTTTTPTTTTTTKKAEESE